MERKKIQTNLKHNVLEGKSSITGEKKEENREFAIEYIRKNF